MDGGIKTTRNDDQFRPKFFSNFEQQLVACVHVLVITQINCDIVLPLFLINHFPGIPSHITSEAESSLMASVLSSSIFAVWIVGTVVGSVQGH